MPCIYTWYTIIPKLRLFVTPVIKYAYNLQESKTESYLENTKNNQDVHRHTFFIEIINIAIPSQVYVFKITHYIMTIIESANFYFYCNRNMKLALNWIWYHLCFIVSIWYIINSAINLAENQMIVSSSLYYMGKKST